MDALQILSFMAVATLLVISPGPNGILIAKTVPVSGKSAGFANIGGFIAAFYVHGSLSILGISILLVQSSQAFFVFKMLGAVYLCWIGLKSLFDAWKNEQTPLDSNSKPKSSSLRGAFFEGFLTNMLNPKVSMFYLAAFPQFVPIGGGASSAYTLVFIHAAINLIWFSAFVIMLSRIKKLAVSSVFARCLKSVTGTVFIAFGVKMAFLKPLENN